MIIWPKKSLDQYTDALTAIDAILKLIIDSPSIINDKEIAWNVFLRIISILFECFPSIFDSNEENITTIVCINYSTFNSIVKASFSFI